MSKKQDKVLSKINLALACLATANCSFLDAAEIIQTKRMWQQHYVQEGETIESIATHYRMKLDELAKINQIKKPYRIYKGQRLHVHKRNFDEVMQIKKTVVIEEKNKPNLVASEVVLTAPKKPAPIEQIQINRQNKGKNPAAALLLPLAAGAALGVGAAKALKSGADSVSNSTRPPGIAPRPVNIPVPRRGQSTQADIPADQDFSNPGSFFSDGPSEAPPPKPQLVSSATSPDIFAPKKDSLLKGALVSAATTTAVGAGMLGLKNLLSKGKAKENKDTIKEQVFKDNLCVRVTFGWPINHSARQFKHINLENEDEGISIINTFKEFFVVPAFPGKIIDVQRPSMTEDKYTITVQHPCEHLTTVYGNIRIPKDEGIDPKALIGTYITKADAIGTINPGDQLMFRIKQITPGKDYRKADPRIQKLGRRVGRLVKWNDEKVEININALRNGEIVNIIRGDIRSKFFRGLDLRSIVIKETRPGEKVVVINDQEIIETNFLDPKRFLPSTSPTKSSNIEA